MPEFWNKDEVGYWDNPPDLDGLAHRPTMLSGVRIRYLPSTPGDYDAPGAVVLSLPPGCVIPRHSHEASRMEFVLEGSMEVSPGVFVRPGGMMRAEAGEMYGPHVVGPEGATTLEVFAVMRAAWRTTYATPRGPEEVDSLNGGVRPADALVTFEPATN